MCLHDDDAAQHELYSVPTSHGSPHQLPAEPFMSWIECLSGKKLLYYYWKCCTYTNQNFPSPVSPTTAKGMWWHWPALALGRVSAGVAVPQAAQRGRAAARGVPGPPAHALYRTIGAVLHLLGPARWQAAQGRRRRQAWGWGWAWVWRRELVNVQVVVTVGAQEHTRCSQSAPAWLSLLRPAPAWAHRCCWSLSERHWQRERDRVLLLTI